MKSKKILAALVAIPASVVVADGALAVEDQKTTTETKVVMFNIQNELVHGTMGSTDVIAEENLNTELAKEIFKLMDEFKDKSTVTLTLPASLKSNETNLQYAKRAVREVFDYLKTNLNKKTNFATSDNYDTTLLYGMFDSLSVEAVETIKTTTEDDSSSVTKKSEVKLELKFDYFGSNSVKTAIKDGTTLDATGAKTASNNVLKIKAIHDYLINRSYVDENKHDLYNLTTQIEGMSSHAYALWTYALIKQLNSGIDVRYVYGLSNGQPRSWVLVKHDDTEPKPWYHLDVASNDNRQKDSKDIKYLHFLTGDPSYVDYIINIGGIDDSKVNKENKLWANIVNPIIFGGLLTYVDPSRGGKIYSINLGSFNESQRFGTDTSLVNNIYSYKEGSTEYIYYLNTNMNNTLYRFNTGGGSPVQIINESLKSISVSGSILTYILLDGKDTEKKVSLNDIEGNLIDKVKVAMDDYLKLISPTEGQKLNVLTAFNTLTTGQQDKLKAITVSDSEGTPKEIYKDLINDITTKVDGEVLNVINSINTLASSKTWTIAGIESIEAAYNILKPAKQALVTNVKVLDNAIEQMGLAKKIQTDIPIFLNKYKLTTSIDIGFYSGLEDLNKRIQELTTALHSIFDSQHLKGLEDANKNRNEAEKEIQVFVNDLNKINVNSKDYITDVKKLEEKYESIADNRKVLLTGTQLDSYNKHVRDAKKMVEAINDFNTKYGCEIKYYSIDEEGVPTFDGKIIQATEYGKMLAAYKLYSDMKPSQLVQIDSEVGDKIVAINKYITILTDSSKEILNKITVEITNLDEAVQNLIKEFKPKMDDLSQTITDDDISKNIEEYKDLVSSAEVAIKTLVTKPDTTPTLDEITALINDTLALLDDEISKKFMAYKDLAGSPDNKVKIIQDSVNDLTEESGPEEITKVKEDYDLLEDVYKLFINTSPLKKELIRIQDSINAKEAKKFLEDITKILSQTPAATLEDVQALLDKAEELKEPVKSLVKANEEYKKLEELQTKLKKDKLTEEEIKKLIAEIIADIKKLTMDSKPAEFAAIEAKYNTLTAENKEKVMNFKDIAELKAKIEAATKEKTDKAAAEKVIEMIQVLNNESTSAEIKAARAAYEALTEEAKKLVNDRVLQNLVYFESLLATQTEQAEKEAKTVMDRINRIDKTKYTEAQIKSIRIAYNALSDLAKSLVTNLHILIDAENYVIYQNTVVKQAKLDANAFDLYMDTITRNSTTQEIAKARSLYNNLSAEAKRHVTTLEKLVRLETMWNDPQYLELVFTYYPDYVHEVKPGAIVVEKPKHDPLYIPDDSIRTPSSVATSTPKTASWSQYETMTHQNGRYTTQITSTQVKNIADRNMRLKAGDVEIVIPTSEIQSSNSAIGVALNIVNNQLNIQFTEGNREKNFSSYIEIYVPVSTLKGNTSQIIERITTTGSSPASFKVDGSNFIIRTTSGGTFKATTSDIRYTDIQNNAQGNAIRELTKRGITFYTTNRLVQSYKQVDKLDMMTMIASALDLSSNSKSKYLDLEKAEQLQQAQGLLEAGIMSGATSSRFNPTAAVTKQEAAIIIANMYRYLNQDLSKVYNELTSNYRDIANLTLEARQSIAILELFGVVDGKGAFNPTQTLSRGEFAELFYKALNAINYL